MRESEEGGEREIGLEGRRRGSTTGRRRRPHAVRGRRAMGGRKRRRRGCSVGSTARFFSCAVDDGGVVDERAFAAKAFDSLWKTDEGGVVGQLVTPEHAPTGAGSELELFVHLGALGVAVGKGGAMAAGKDEREGAEGRGQLGVEEGIVVGVIGEDGRGEGREGDGLVGGGGGGGGGDTAENEVGHAAAE